jgi:DNA-directed RNA polymerase subunit beta'
LKRVLYCEAYVVIDPMATPPRKRASVLERRVNIKRLRIRAWTNFKAGMGGEAVRDLASQDRLPAYKDLRKLVLRRRKVRSGQKENHEALESR